MPYTPGPFDREHIYVQWGGKLPGNDIWSCGFRMRKISAGAVDDGSTLISGIATAITAYHQSTQLNLSQAAKLSFVKVNAINTAGHYRSTGSTNEVILADLPGAVGGAQFPNQVCCAVSLTTGFSRGPAHRGRFYVPLPTYAIGTDGRIGVTDVNRMSAASAALMTSINTVNADYEMAVFSRKSGAAGNRRVTGVLVGRTMDTQRRRRNKVLEDWR